MVQADCLKVTNPIPVIFIAGPTAGGKTDLALSLQTLGALTVINADSRQIFRGMPIGTAQPEYSLYPNVQFELFAHRDPVTEWNAMDYARSAVVAIQKAHDAHRIPVIVGGTGLYFKALSEGFMSMPALSDQARQVWENKLANQGISSLYAELNRVDPERAVQIQPNDAQRVGRALSIFWETGRTMSSWLNLPKKPLLALNPLYLALLPDREYLYARINQRVDSMINQGLEEEARLLWQTYGATPVLQRTLGYKDWPDYWQGQCSLLAIKEKLAKETRHYAKRQLTWLRHQCKNYHFLTNTLERDRLMESIKRHMR